MTAVLAVDDDAMQLRLWERSLVGAPFGLLTTHDPTAAVRLATGHQVSVALVDTHMAHLSGPEVVRHLLSAMPDLPIIAVSADESAHAIVDMMRAGAHDYLIKPVEDDLLIRTIEGLLPAESGSGTSGSLTRREAQVIGLLGEGFATGDIAVRLGLHAKTIDGLFIRLRRKLACDSVAALRRYAVRLRQDRPTDPSDSRIAVLGDLRIDHQHRHMHKLFLATIRALHEGQPSAGDLAGELRAYAAYHVAEEEGLMRLAGWPDLEHHRDEHRRLLAAIAPATDGPAAPARDAERIRAAMAGWLQGHVPGADHQFVAWRRQRP